ncbi:MAG: DUF2019 domain-containing protein [Chitinispirillia bacterium]|nr:DUF2019 domain-containing protein [Chitinispirillia bacterium]
MKISQKKTKHCKSIEELAAEYAKYAGEHGQATEVGDYKKGNKAWKKLIKIYLQIEEEGCLVHPLFREMLSSPDPGVRSWAATHSLKICPKEAEAVLADVGKTPRSLVALCARTILEEWKKGTLDLSYS